MSMTLWKPALGLALALALTACAPAETALQGDAAAASRAARSPGTLTEIDIVRAVQSSL
jgi:hypothetical protein